MALEIAERYPPALNVSPNTSPANALVVCPRYKPEASRFTVPKSVSQPNGAVVAVAVVTAVLGLNTIKYSEELNPFVRPI